MLATAYGLTEAVNELLAQDELTEKTDCEANKLDVAMLDCKLNPAQDAVIGYVDPVAIVPPTN